MERKKLGDDDDDDDNHDDVVVIDLLLRGAYELQSVWRLRGRERSLVMMMMIIMKMLFN